MAISRGKSSRHLEQLWRGKKTNDVDGTHDGERH